MPVCLTIMLICFSLFGKVYPLLKICSTMYIFTYGHGFTFTRQLFKTEVVYLSDFEKTPHRENITPVISKTAPIISTGNKSLLDTVCQYLPNSVCHSVVFSTPRLATKDEQHNINTPVNSILIPAIIFFHSYPPNTDFIQLEIVQLCEFTSNQFTPYVTTVHTINIASNPRMLFKDSRHTQQIPRIRGGAASVP